MFILMVSLVSFLPSPPRFPSFPLPLSSIITNPSLRCIRSEQLHWSAMGDAASAVCEGQGMGPQCLPSPRLPNRERSVPSYPFQFLSDFMFKILYLIVL